MGCIYIALLSKALYNLCLTFTHAHTHSYTVGRGTRAGLQPAQREQLELGVLLKDTTTDFFPRRSWTGNTDLSVAGRGLTTWTTATHMCTRMCTLWLCPYPPPSFCSIDCLEVCPESQTTCFSLPTSSSAGYGCHATGLFWKINFRSPWRNIKIQWKGWRRCGSTRKSVSSATPRYYQSYYRVRVMPLTTKECDRKETAVPCLCRGNGRNGRNGRKTHL